MIIAANLKTNFTRKQTSEYIEEIEKFLRKKNLENIEKY